MMTFIIMKNSENLNAATGSEIISSPFFKILHDLIKRKWEVYILLKLKPHIYSTLPALKRYRE